MYKRLIYVLLVFVLVIIGTTLAQEITAPPSLPEEVIDISSGSFNGEDIVEGFSPLSVLLDIGDGQTTTGMDIVGYTNSGVGYMLADSIGISGNSEGSGTTDSGTVEQVISDPIPKLILSEVYFDGTDEWIEITNIGDGNFQGNVTLVGAKSTPVSLSGISLLSGESKLFGDTLAQISGTTWIGKTGLALNMTDTVPIVIQMLVSGQVVDDFVVDQYRINIYNDQKTSFERVGDIRTRVQSDRVVNAHSGYIINPGRYWTTGIDISNVSIPPGQSGENLQQPLSCDSLYQPDLIKINEIFPGNEKYPPYIELIVLQQTNIQKVSISGDMVSTGVEFIWGGGGTTLEKNTLLLLAATGFRQSEGIFSVRNSDFSLVSTGNHLLITISYRQSGQVLDIVYGSGNTAGKSLYFKDSGYPCGRILDALDDFSPGFERKFLKYFSGTTSVKIEYVWTGAINQSGNETCQPPTSDETTTGDVQVQTGISSIPGEYIIRILNIEYDPEGSDTNNEKITLLATHVSGNKAPLDLSKIFRLKVNGTNKTLPWILPIDVPTTFTKTFGFPNGTDDGQPVVVTLTYGDYIFDTYTYNPNTPVIPKELKEQVTGDVQSTGTLLNLSGLQFTITYVLPNPKGSDKFEEIGLVIYPTPTLPIAWRGSSKTISSLRSGEGVGGEVTREQLDLSQGFSLRVGKSKKKLKGIVQVGQENILSGSLGLVNKAACVSLWYQEEELAVFCYPTPKEGQKISASYQEMETASGNSLDILNALKITRIDRDMCVMYGDLPFLCKRFPASKAETKVIQEQRLYKGFASLIKQYVINNRKVLYYETPLKQYFDLVADNKKLIGKGYAQVDIYGQSVPITNLKQQIEIMDTTLPGIIALYEGKKALFGEQ